MKFPIMYLQYINPKIQLRELQKTLFKKRNHTGKNTFFTEIQGTWH